VSAAEPAPDTLAFLARERARVDAALERILARLTGPAAVVEPARHGVRAGGKRIRPVLCIAACRAAGGARPEAALVELACTLELVHTYSLLHDDLPCMDDAELRRGRPATHRVHGAAATTLAGAALLSHAFRTLEHAGRTLGLEPEERAALAATLAAAAGAGGLVGGQFLDLEAEGERLDLPAIEEIHARKTGALLTAAARMGALAARAPAPVADALTAYGRSLGLAFQIADDILDVVGAAAQLGKTPRRDQALRKATVPAVLGVEAARARARAAAEDAIAALRAAGIQSPELEALARHAAERDR